MDELWQNHGLADEEALDLERARPFIKKYIQRIRKFDDIDDGMIAQIFNEIDEDGN